MRRINPIQKTSEQEGNSGGHWHGCHIKIHLRCPNVWEMLTFLLEVCKPFESLPKILILVENSLMRFGNESHGIWQYHILDIMIDSLID